MSDAEDNVVPHPSRDAWEERQTAQREGNRRAQAAERDAERSRRLNEQRAALQAAANSRLTSADRLALARNLGRLALHICRNDQRAATRLAAAALEPNRHLRARWVRFPTEQIEQKSADEIAAQLKGAVGTTYLKIAEYFASASTVEGRQSVTRDDATLRLLRGTGFDPRPEMLQIATDQEAELNACLGDIRAELLKSAPELGSYFELVSAHELQHVHVGDPVQHPPFGYDVSRFVTVASTDERGLCAGHLVPRAISDGYFMTEESRGIECLLPSTLLGELRVQVPLPSVALTADDAAGLLAGEIGGEAVAKIFAARAVSDIGGSDGIWAFSLNVHLVAAPMGTSAPKDIGLALIVSPVEEANERTSWAWLGERQLFVQCREAAPGQFEGAVFDRSAISSFPAFAALLELDDRLWSAGEETAQTLLFAPIAPPEFEYLLPAPLMTFRPAFSGLEGFAPLPANTLAGLIQRNNRPENGPGRLVQILAADANARAARLSEQLAALQQDFEEKRDNHRRALGIESDAD